MKIYSHIIQTGFFLAVICYPLLISGQTYTPAKPYGETKLINDFICSEVIYPEESIRMKQEGEVVLKFIVGTDGTVSDIRIKEGVSPQIDMEAIRVFRLLQWHPAVRLGNPVTSEEEYTFKFNIKKYNRHCKQRGYEQPEYPHMPVDTSLEVYNIEQLDLVPQPIFDDKSMTLGKFITENLIYPEAAYKQDISGKVVLSFVVETHGGHSNIIIEEPVGGGCTEEALRILKLIRWFPGLKDDVAVRSRIHLSITFQLTSDNEHRVFDNNQAGAY